jgi:hypothetical protein
VESTRTIQSGGKHGPLLPGFLESPPITVEAGVVRMRGGALVAARRGSASASSESPTTGGSLIHSSPTSDGVSPLQNNLGPSRTFRRGNQEHISRLQNGCNAHAKRSHLETYSRKDITQGSHFLIPCPSIQGVL